jgi:hypothetical protein
MPDYRLDDADLALLRSPSQRYKLRIAYLPVFTPTVTDWARDPGVNDREAFEWTPELNLTSSTIGVVGSPVSYYLGNAQTRSGSGIAAEDKSFDWGDDTVISPADGTISHNYEAAGLYEVLFTATADGETFTAHRWVKVFDDLADADGPVEVTGLASSGGGWSVTLKVTGDVSDFPDRMGVILWLEQTWGVDDVLGLGTQKTLGATGENPSILFVGYVVGSTVRVDADSNDVTFQVKTAEAFLHSMRLHQMVFLDSTKTGFGHVRDDLTFADAVNHLLNRHSNWGEWHGFSCWRQNWPNVNLIGRVTLNEGFIWEALTDCASNELGILQARSNSEVEIRPDVNVRGLTWWGTNTTPPEFPFDSRNMTSIVVEKALTDRIGYVELVAADPFGGTTLTAKFPSGPSAVGDYDGRDILCRDQGNMDAWAERLYYADNARYRVTITTGLTKPLQVGQLVVVDHADPQKGYDFTGEVGGDPYRKPFVVDAVSYQIDQAAGTWTSTIVLLEVVRMRWVLGSDVWETYNGSSWEGV